MEQNKHKALSPRDAIRLADLMSWHVLWATCFRCHRVAEVDVRWLKRRWPNRTRLIDLERRLRCAACGNGSDNRFSASKLPRNS